MCLWVLGTELSLSGLVASTFTSEPSQWLCKKLLFAKHLSRVVTASQGIQSTMAPRCPQVPLLLSFTLLTCSHLLSTHVAKLPLLPL